MPTELLFLRGKNAKPLVVYAGRLDERRGGECGGRKKDRKLNKLFPKKLDQVMLCRGWSNYGGRGGGLFFASINQAKLDGRKRELVGWPFPVIVQSRSKGCVVSRSEEGLITTGCQVRKFSPLPLSPPSLSIYRQTDGGSEG